MSIFNAPFWENFWPNLIADAIIAILFGYAFVKWLNFYNRPKLSLVIATQENFPDGTKETRLNIRNSGRTSININEANAHIYLPAEIKIEPSYLLDKGIEEMGKSIINGKVYTHYSKFNSKPIFPERDIRIFRFRHKPTETVNKIYYHFATVHGLMPKKRWLVRKINKKNGEIKLNLLPHIVFN